ncbi:MAG: amidohydrolase [Pseudomonadota bacterium]
MTNPLRRFVLASAFALPFASFIAQPVTADHKALSFEVHRDLRTAIEADYDNHLSDLFVWFHKHAELSGKEIKTAARLAKEFRGLGFEVTEGVGGTGIVAVLENGEGPRVLMRADMDGLPVMEASGLPYASENKQETDLGAIVPVMHACGHDTHITALVGAARQLIARKDEWRGTVVLIGQPAEETVQGAKNMLADGLYERFGVPDYAIGFHVAANGPAGKVGLKSGLLLSSVDSVDITVRGIGAHGASPHQGKDPIYMAAQIIMGLQGIISREISPLEPGVITVGSIHGGNKHNIISDRVDLQLTVRSDNDDVRNRLLEGIKRVAENIGRVNGMPEDLLPVVKWGEEFTYTTDNAPEETARVLSALKTNMGEDRLYEIVRLGMGGEDFPFFTKTEHKVPGVFMFVGGTAEETLEAAKEGKATVASHHSPFFKIDPDAAVPTGTEAMVVAAMELLARPASRKTAPETNADGD